MPHSRFKYSIQLSFQVEGVVEERDIIGAIFGQSEGLFGPEKDLDGLRRAGKAGRIDVDFTTTEKSTFGSITIPLNADIDDCLLVAATIEGVDRMGPFDCKFKMGGVGDIKAKRKGEIAKRAQRHKRNWKSKRPDRG